MFVLPPLQFYSSILPIFLLRTRLSTSTFGLSIAIEHERVVAEDRVPGETVPPGFIHQLGLTVLRYNDEYSVPTGRAAVNDSMSLVSITPLMLEPYLAFEEMERSLS